MREAARFVLGTNGLVQNLRAANAASLGYLAFIGTWHSHPKGGPHSGIDRNTLRGIAEDAGGLPAVSLVWTPTGLTCAVDAEQPVFGRRITLNFPLRLQTSAQL